jgi:hypothetical protein
MGRSTRRKCAVLHGSKWSKATAGKATVWLTRRKRPLAAKAATSASGQKRSSRERHAPITQAAAMHTPLARA